MKKICLLAFIFLLLSCTESKAQLFWNQAASFSGNLNSYVSVANSSGINLNGSFTLECWIKPNNVNTLQGLIWKQNPGGYAYTMVLAANGKILVGTNNAPRLTGKTVLTANQWTHVAATYNSVTNIFILYLNGVADTSASVAGSVPASSSDSLFLGKFISAFPYSGLMDEVRIWNNSLNSFSIKNNYRTSLGVTGQNSFYAGLVLSLAFQNRNNSGNTFTLFDWSRTGNAAFNRGITQASFTNQPSSTISYNESLYLDGTGDYAALGSNADVDITGPFSMEAWVYLDDYNPGFHQTIMRKRLSNVGAGFALVINSSKKLVLSINNIGAGTSADFPLRRWVHVAVTQNNSGLAKIFMDGNQVFSFTYPLASSNTDSFYVGGTGFGENFNGYIDEVRLSKYEKTQQQVKDLMYRSIEATNDLNPSASDVVFNFDGNTNTNCDANMQIYLRGDTKFSNPNTIDWTPISPMLRNDAINFSTGYRMKTVNKRVPTTGTSGPTFDTIAINSSASITDINLFLASNHRYDRDLEVTLFAPNGDSANICFDRSLNTNTTGDIITIFDDNADSALANDKWTSYAPRIKPETNLNSVFGGDNPFGKWILKINDDAAGDTGYVYSFGIQLNNQTLVGTEVTGSTVPETFELSQNYPNPFNPVTNIQYQLPVTGMVKLKVFDIAGKEVALIVNENKQAGTYNVQFEASKLSSGVYFYKLEAEGFFDVKKMILVK